jgi:hypothetical protein
MPLSRHNFFANNNLRKSLLDGGNLAISKKLLSVYRQKAVHLVETACTKTVPPRTR